MTRAFVCQRLVLSLALVAALYTIAFPTLADTNTASNREPANPTPVVRRSLWGRLTSSPKGVWKKVTDWLYCEPPSLSREQETDDDQPVRSALQTERGPRHGRHTGGVVKSREAPDTAKQEAAPEADIQKTEKEDSTHKEEGFTLPQPVPQKGNRNLRRGGTRPVAVAESEKETVASSTTSSTTTTAAPVETPGGKWVKYLLVPPGTAVPPTVPYPPTIDDTAPRRSEPREPAKEAQRDEADALPSKEGGTLPQQELPGEVPATKEGVESPGAQPFPASRPPRIAVALGLRRYPSGRRYQFGTGALHLPPLPGGLEIHSGGGDFAEGNPKSLDSIDTRREVSTLPVDGGHSHQENPKPRRLLQQVPVGGTEAMPPDEGTHHGGSAPQQSDQEGRVSRNKMLDAGEPAGVPEGEQQPESCGISGRQCRPASPAVGVDRQHDEEQAHEGRIAAGPWRFFIAEDD
uniref:Uncharacterized protein n=1 Tax=Neospora caninum (strain Liverpool) TaxID=572307 RepID=A0A0F7UEK0_NEOCL|nr:TPA: hypothetical protein BN1204_025840 [Neospora caninum Liverpool]